MRFNPEHAHEISYKSAKCLENYIFGWQTEAAAIAQPFPSKGQEFSVRHSVEDRL
jgi:hypothetical protein